MEQDIISTIDTIEQYESFEGFTYVLRKFKLLSNKEHAKLHHKLTSTHEEFIRCDNCDELLDRCLCYVNEDGKYGYDHYNDGD